MRQALPDLEPYERGEKSRAEMARELGVHPGHLRRLMQAERRRQARRELLHVPVVSGSQEGYHYRLDLDQASVLPDGPFRILDGRGHLKTKHKLDAIAGPGATRAKEPAKHKPRSRKRVAKKLTPQELEQIKAKGMRRKKVNA